LRLVRRDRLDTVLDEQLRERGLRPGEIVAPEDVA
jgi:hypothetical protein